jgi:hypothetical protein
MKFRWPMWLLLGITVAVTVLAAIIEWEKSHGS